MNMEFDFAYTVDDMSHYLKALPEVTRRIPAEKAPSAKFRYRALIGWVIILAIAVVLFIIFHDDKPPQPAPPAKTFGQFIGPYVPFVFIFLVFWIYFLRKLSSPAQRAFEQDPSLADMRHVTISDDGISVQLPTHTLFMTWKHFFYFAETDKLFILMITRQMSFFLPKRVFLSPELQAEFRTFAHTQLPRPTGGFPVEPGPAL